MLETARVPSPYLVFLFLLHASPALALKPYLPWGDGHFDEAVKIKPAEPALPPGEQTSEQVPSEAKRTPSANRVAVSVRTDKGIYKDGESVKVSGKVVNLRQPALSTVVAVDIYRRGAGDAADEQLVYQQILEPKDDEFGDAGYVVQFPNGSGLQREFLEDLFETKRIIFDVEARVFFRDTDTISVAQSDAATPRAGATFSAEQVSLAGLFLVALYPAFLGLVLLTVAYSAFIGAADKRRLRWGMVLVYCVGLLGLMTAFVGPLLVSASPSTEALLRTTPVGIARAALTKGGDVEWVLNLGGVLDAENTLTGGFGVPLFVVVLALVGGVMSMLLKLSNFLSAYDGIDPTVDGAAVKVSELRALLLHEFIAIVSAPFIGLIAFSLASLADYTNHYALSVVAFGVGFVSDQIVAAVRGFAVRVLGAHNEPPTPPDDTGATEGDAEHQATTSANGGSGTALAKRTTTEATVA